MYIKKSIIEAEDRAKELSLKHPDIVYYVMDKKRQEACCHGSEWAVREKILSGWHPVCRYKNGERKL